MSEENTSMPSTAKGGREKWIKKVLLLAIIFAMVAIYFYQRRGLDIKGWGEDLNATLIQAKAETRPVVVMFVNKSQTPTARALKKHINQPGNRKALKQGNYLTVMVYLDNALDSEVAQKYEIKSLPTLLLLRPDGMEHNRAVGNIGEVSFRQEFLNYNKADSN